MTHDIGDVLGGRYTLRERIASGGMGDVWRATDAVLGRPVAVKILRASPATEASFAARFRDEARHSAGLTHPNIAAVFDYGEDAGTAYLVMELVPGQPLSELVAAGPIPPERTRAILGQCALALAAAHEAGVVHRDVKPANILVTPEGQVKLTDFGIARAVDVAGHTRTGEVMGTPQYLAPEQAMGRPVTGATDLYALGVVGYEMLTGTRPFDAGSPVATALAHINDAPPPLPAWVGDPLRAAIEACLAKDPLQRPSSAASLAALLGMPVSGVAQASPATEVVPITDLGPTEAMTMPVPPPAATPGYPSSYAGPARDAGFDDFADPSFGGAAPESQARRYVTGAEQSPQRRRSGGWWWALPAVIALVAGYLLWTTLSRPGSSTPPPTVSVTTTVTTPATSTRPPTTAPTTSATPSVKTVTIVESDFLGQSAGIVRSDLSLLGFAKIDTKSAASDKPVGTVVKVSPTGDVPVTTTIVLTVSSGPATSAPPPTTGGGPTTGGSGG